MIAKAPSLLSRDPRIGYGLSFAMLAGGLGFLGVHGNSRRPEVPPARPARSVSAWPGDARPASPRAFLPVPDSASRPDAVAMASYAAQASAPQPEPMKDSLAEDYPLPVREVPPVGPERVVAETEDEGPLPPRRRGSRGFTRPKLGALEPIAPARIGTPSIGRPAIGYKPLSSISALSSVPLSPTGIAAAGWAAAGIGPTGVSAADIGGIRAGRGGSQ